MGVSRIRLAAPASLLLAGLLGCSANNTAPAPVPSSTRIQALLDTVQQRTFNFFWERTGQATGLTPDRWPTPSFSSIAAVGFALTAYPIGVEQGYVTRGAAAQRTLNTLQFFYRLPQGPGTSGIGGYQGFFYHFLDLSSGLRYQDVELSSIDTSLLLAGVLFSQQYFDRADPAEAAIRAYADSLYRRVDWRWFQPRPPLLSHGWRVEEGFNSIDWRGLDEAMIIYILALGSPTHAVDAAAWPAWTSTYPWGEFYGQAHVGFAPLFGHQYTQVWVDFRGIADDYMRSKGIDYFENSRRATYGQRGYAMANPNDWDGYGADLFGLSASDGPMDVTLTVRGRPRRFFSYAARGASFTEVRDDGTLSPAGAAGSLPFAPEIVGPTLVAMRERYGDGLFGQYGFLDSFNPTWQWAQPAPQYGHYLPGKGWFDTDYLGIDQGPILAMIANYRTDLVWKYMRKSPYIIQGLRRAGFQGGWLTAAP